MSGTGEQPSDPLAAAHRELWTRASSLHDLGELTAQWLTGDIVYQPCCDGGPDSETRDLVPVLAAMNRADYVTDFSQPGEPPQHGWMQRASVTGFCSEATADRLREACSRTEIVALVFPPDLGYAQVVVTVDDEDEVTWIGAPMSAAETVDYYAEDLAPAALAALAVAWQVHIVDPAWGRNDQLWRVVRDGLALGDVPLPK